MPKIIAIERSTVGALPMLPSYSPMAMPVRCSNHALLAAVLVGCQPHPEARGGAAARAPVESAGTIADASLPPAAGDAETGEPDATRAAVAREALHCPAGLTASTFVHPLAAADWPVGERPTGAPARSFSMCVPDGYRLRPTNALGEHAWEPAESAVFHDAAAAAAHARKPRVSATLARSILDLATSEQRARADAHAEGEPSTVKLTPQGLELVVRPGGGAAVLFFWYARVGSTPELGARCTVAWSAAKDAPSPLTYIDTARAICGSLRAAE